MTDAEATLVQIQTAFGLLEPVSEMLRLTQEALIAHHPKGHVADDCDVCRAYLPALVAVSDRFEAAKKAAAQAWEVE